MTDKPVIDFDPGTLDADARQRLVAAAGKAGVTLRPATGDGLQVKAADQGTIETSLSINTKDLDGDAIDAARAKAYDATRHTRIIDSVIKGALGTYGVGSKDEGDLFVQWVWCQWQQFHSMEAMADNETFMKRFIIRPPAATAAAAVTADTQWS